MRTEIKSRHAVVSRAPHFLFMVFTDMRNFVQFLPEDRRKDITVDFDSLKATVQGFSVGVKVAERAPYSMIRFEDDGAPFSFSVEMHFDEVPGTADKTDFHIELSADLNLMMKMMLGSKLQEALDRLVDGLAAVSEGRMPEGVDPSMFQGGSWPSEGFPS